MAFRAASNVVRFPPSVGQRRDRDRLAPVEADERGVDELADLHDALLFVDVAPRFSPDVGAGGGRQHGLDVDAAGAQLRLKRFGEGEDEGLGCGVDAGRYLGRERQHRGHVDDCARAPRQKSWNRGSRQPYDRRDVQADQRFLCVEVGGGNCLPAGSLQRC